jgi:GT2 family glycosyltransferase
MKPPLISIGILNHNGLIYLKKTISSALEQRYSNFEIVVVDNGSTDKSIEYLESLKNKNIKIVKNGENYGYSKGKNICVEKCKGKYILLIDEDIEILGKNCLDNFIKFYKENKGIAFLAPIFRDIKSNTTKYYGAFSSWYGLNIHKNKVKIPNLKNKFRIGSFHGGAVFFNKNIWNQLGGYDELQSFMLDDFDLGFRAYLFGYKNYLYPKEELIHTGKNKDCDKKRFAWKFKYYFSGIATMMWKNYNLKNLILRFPIFLIYSIFLYAGLAILKLNWRMIPSLMISWAIFLKNIPKILKKRKNIQLERTIKSDIFLKIKSPKSQRYD